MGATTSTKKKQGNWSWNGPPGDHSPFPIDRIPYPGSDLLYCYVDIMVSHKILRNQINLGPPAVTTNVEQYLDRITDCYRQGFQLVKFVRVPCVKMTTELTDWTSVQPYQAILVKPASMYAEMKESWDLVVEKQILSTRTLAYNETDGEEDGLLHTIRRYAESGARLVAAESVGYVRSETTNTQYGIIGVELFFNVPQHTFTTKYTYHTITLPANYHIIHDVTQLSQKVVCDADFLGQLKLFLNAGWKLIDICLDSTAIADTFRTKAQSKRIETIWIFEKETAKLFDETPVYEGAIIEYLHKVKVASDGESSCRDWRPVIAGMGVSGWELASIIQTPLLVQSTFSVYTMKLLLIFQRPLAHLAIRTRSMHGRTVGFDGSGSRRSRSAERRPFDAEIYPPGARSGSLRGQPGGGPSGGHFYGNSTMADGPVANGYVKFSTGAVTVTSAAAADIDLSGTSRNIPQQAPNTLRTYRTYTSQNEGESNSSLTRTPKSVQLRRARRDFPVDDDPQLKSRNWKDDSHRGKSDCLRKTKERNDKTTQNGKYQIKGCTTQMGYMTSSNDEEGEIDDNGRNTYSRYSSSISSSTDNGHPAADLKKLSIFSPVVEMPMS